jgi:hypothetical protein
MQLPLQVWSLRRIEEGCLLSLEVAMSQGEDEAIFVAFLVDA